jgi:sterol desaturase/sphingolipid hydroxylase (fatty acid hydroxylase superfamily)
LTEWRATAHPVAVPDLAVTFLALTAIIAVRYLATSALIHALVQRRPDRPRPPPGAIRHELTLSLAASAVYAAPAAWVLEAWKQGGTALYSDWSAMPLWWVPVSALVYLFVQDAHYYWVHRLMHHRALFRWFHAGHHRSHTPTAFASFAFDLTEAAMVAWVIPVLALIVPIHIGVLVALLILMTATATLNHCGVEIWPERFVRGPVGGWLITATHHGLHHRRLQTNFGLHFRLWDRLMGTDAMPAPTPSKSP